MKPFTLIRFLVVIIFICLITPVQLNADAAKTEYLPDGSIRTTNASMEMAENGIIHLYDKNNIKHGIHLAMRFRANNEWFYSGNIPDIVIVTNANNRKTTCSGNIIPPDGSVDTTPIQFRFYMQLLDTGKVLIAAEFDTPLDIYDILISCEIKDHVTPRSALVGHNIVADNSTYTIADNTPLTERNLLHSNPINQISIMDDVPDQNIKYEIITSINEYIYDYEYGDSIDKIEARIGVPSGGVNKVAWEMTFPEETPAVEEAVPVYQSDGTITIDSATIAMSTGGSIVLNDTNGLKYTIHLSMKFQADNSWFTSNWPEGVVTDSQVTIDTTNQKTTFTGNIQPVDGSVDMTEIPVEFYMQLLSNNKVHIGVNFDRTGSIYDILVYGDIRIHITPHSGLAGHIIDTDGTEHQITDEPPTSTSILIQGSSINTIKFMKDSPLQTVIFEKTESQSEKLYDYYPTTRSSYYELQYKSVSTTNTVGFDITLPPVDTNPSDETYGETDFWKSSIMRMPEFDKSINLVSNPGFEHGANYWEWNRLGDNELEPTVDTYFQIDDTESYEGNRSLKLIGKVDEETSHFKTFAIPVERNETYTLSFYAKTDVPGTKLRMFGDTNNKTYLQHHLWSSTLDGNWQRFEGNFTTPNGLIAIGFRITGQTNDCNVWLDAVQIEKAASATTFTKRPYSTSLITDSGNNMFEPSVNPNAYVRIVGTSNTSGTINVYLQDFNGDENLVQESTFSIGSGTETTVAQTWNTDLDQGIYVVRMVTTVNGSSYTDYDRITIMPYATVNTPGRELFTIHAGPTTKYGEWSRQYDYFNKLGIGSAIFFNTPPTGLYSVLDQYDMKYFCSILDSGEAAGINLHENYDLTSQELADIQTHAYNKALANPDVNYWKLINEPYMTAITQTEIDNMLEVIEALSTGIKQANPNAQVLTNDPYNMHVNYGINYIDKLLENGVDSYCDIVAIHPYRTLPEDPDLDADCASLMNVLADNNFTGDVWFSEGIYYNNYILPKYGLNTHVGCSTDHYCARNFTYAMGWGERMCAAYTARSYLVAMKYGDRVKLFVDWGLNRNIYLDYDLTPTASAMAVNTLVHTLGAATYQGEVEIEDNTRCYVFTDNQGNHVAAIWIYGYDTDHQNKEAGSLDLSALVSQYSNSDISYIDFMGNCSELEEKLPLHPWPVFIKLSSGSSSSFITSLNQATYSE